MVDLVRIVGLKEPYLTYGTRRLRAGDEMDVPHGYATLATRRGLAMVAERQPRAKAQPQQPSVDGDDIEILRATARALNIKVDGRWSVKRLIAEIEKAR